MNSSSGLSAASNTPAVMNAVSAGNRRGSASCPSMRGYDAIHSSTPSPDAAIAVAMSASVAATPVTETIRGLLLGHASPLPLASALAWCTGIAVVSIALSAILFRRRTAA